MKRNTIRKRAVSCIAALALVVSCILTVFAGTIVPFNGDGSNGKGQIKITTNGGTVQYEFGSRIGSTKSGTMGSYDIGTKCKLTTADTATRVFLYWVDEYANRIYSYDRDIEFTLGSRMHLRATFARVADSEHYVTFVNYGGTIFKDNSDAYATGQTVSIPTDTKVPGFTFKGWTKTASDIASDDGDIIVFPQYTVNDESYTVELTNEEYVSGAGTYTNFQTVNLKAEEKNGSGETFSYWKDADDNIVSYERNYSFRINYNTTLTAVYGESVTPEPVIRISKINRDLADMKLTFYAERSVPENYTVVSHGMLMASGTSVTEQDMVIARAGDTSTSIVRKVYGTSNEPCGTFSLAKAKVGATTEVSARAFVIYQDAEGSQFIAYSDLITTTNGAES